MLPRARCPSVGREVLSSVPSTQKDLIFKEREKGCTRLGWGWLSSPLQNEKASITSAYSRAVPAFHRHGPISSTHQHPAFVPLLPFSCAKHPHSRPTSRACPSRHPPRKSQSPEFLQGSGHGEVPWQILPWLQTGCMWFSLQHCSSDEQNPRDVPLRPGLAGHTPRDYTLLVLISGKVVDLGHACLAVCHLWCLPPWHS